MLIGFILQTQERALLDDPQIVRTLTYVLIGIGSFAAISLALVSGACACTYGTDIITAGDWRVHTQSRSPQGRKLRTEISRKWIVHRRVVHRAQFFLNIDKCFWIFKDLCLAHYALLPITVVRAVPAPPSAPAHAHVWLSDQCLK